MATELKTHLLSWAKYIHILKAGLLASCILAKKIITATASSYPYIHMCTSLCVCMCVCVCKCSRSIHYWEISQAKEWSPKLQASLSDACATTGDGCFDWKDLSISTSYLSFKIQLTCHFSIKPPAISLHWKWPSPFYLGFIIYIPVFSPWWNKRLPESRARGKLSFISLSPLQCLAQYLVPMRGSI